MSDASSASAAERWRFVSAAIFCSHFCAASSISFAAIAFAALIASSALRSASARAAAAACSASFFFCFCFELVVARSCWIIAAMLPSDS